MHAGNVRRNTILQIMIATLAFLLLLRIWPGMQVRQHTFSKQQGYDQSLIQDADQWAEDSEAAERFTSADKKLQTIYFSHPHLYQMTLYVNCLQSGKNDYVLFRIYDDSFSCIYEEQYGCARIAADGYLRAEPELDVDTARTYYYEVIVPQDTKTVLILPTASRAALAQTENSTLYIDGIINESVCLVADYDYTQPLSVFWILFYDLLIIAVACFLYMGCAALLERFEDSLLQVSLYARRTVGAGVILLAGMILYQCVIRNIFDGEGWDRVVYTIGILTGVFWCFCLLFCNQTKRKPSKLAPDRQQSLIWRNYIQTLSFGFLFYALCQYVNADREYYHEVNTRWMLIFFGIACLMLLTWKELCNLLSAVWLAVSILIAMIVCFQMSGTEEELILARLTAGVVVVWGLVVLNTILARYREILNRSLLKSFSKPMIILWLLFSIGMYAYRFEKVWVFTATLPFAVLLFYQLSPAAKSRLLRNFTNGILVSFGLTTLFCLQHRPYHYWMAYRYGGFFHTVSCTGMYLAVVLGAVVAKLFGKLKDREGGIRYCWKEFFFAGSAFSFILLTMSRTALLTASVNIVLVIALAACVYRKTPRRIVQETAVLIGACLICFPLVYSVVRTVPALSDDPIRYDVEFQDRSFMIYQGDAIDSDKYMNIERYFDLLFGRFQTVGQDSEGEETAFCTPVRTGQEALYASAGMYSYALTGPVASTRAQVEESEGEETKNYVLEAQSDISNGRFQIYQDYLKLLSLQGHPKVAITTEAGEEYAHAHNSYLQIAYNFGIPMGIVFLALCAVTLWRSVELYRRQGKRYGIYLVPFSLIVVFGFVSLTEWASHPCFPIGFAFLLCQMLLMQDTGKDAQKGAQK